MINQIDGTEQHVATAIDELSVRLTEQQTCMAL